MWEEESTSSSYISSREGPESARESVVDTDDEAELYSYIHHEHADHSQAVGSPRNSNKIPSSSNSSGPTASFLSLLEGQKQIQEPKEGNQAQAKQPAPTSVYGNRIYEVVRGKIKSWSKPESSILNWLGDVPEKNFNKSASPRLGNVAPSDTPVSTETKKAVAVPAKPSSVKLSVSYQVTESSVNVGPFNSCARLESSAVNWMRDVSCNRSKSPKSPNSNSSKDSQAGSEASKNAKSQPTRQNASKANSGDTNCDETDKTDSSLKVRTGSTQPIRTPIAANDASKKSPNFSSKPEPNTPRTPSSAQQQMKIAPFITSPKVVRGSAASLQVGSFSMDSQSNDKQSKKKTKNQKVAFVTPLTEVGQRSAMSKGDEPCRSKSNLSVTFSTKEREEANESKYNYSGRRPARHGSPQRVVDFSGGNNAKHGRSQHDKAHAVQNKSALKKKGEKLVVDFSYAPKEAIDLLSTSSEASCPVIPESDISSDLESVHSGKQTMDLPISIAIHIGDASRNVVVRNTSSESTVQEPKIKKRKLKNETKKPSSNKATRKSGTIVGLVSDSEVSFEEQMRKFYDSENSDVEQDDGQRQTSGDWSVLDVDRHANIKASNRYFVGFDQKQKLFCGNCKQRGHVMRTCPEPRRILHCTLCGEPYHKAEVCFEMTCSRCLRRGHSTDSCQVSSKYLDPPCNLCWMPGHMEDQCPDYWRRYYLTTKVGPIVQGNTTDSKEPSCYNCASKFHWGYECRKPRMCPDIYPTYPFVVSYEQPHPPRSKNHNSHRLSAGRDVAHIEKEIHRLVAASNYVWQQESAEIRRSFKRFKGVTKKITVEERRKLKQEAKMKKRVENAQRRLDRKVQKDHPGTHTSKKHSRVTETRHRMDTEKQPSKTARSRNKFGYNMPLNQCWQPRNRKHGSDSSFFQETRVNKNSIGRKRAQNHETHSSGKHRRVGETEASGSGRKKRNRRRNRK